MGMGEEDGVERAREAEGDVLHKWLAGLLGWYV